MTGVTERSEPERMVSLARQAITRDLVEHALAVPGLGPVIVATNSAVLAGHLAGLPVVVDRDKADEPFHFGRRLLALIAEHGLERCFYVGGGAGPLLSRDDLAGIAARLAAADRLVITNNFYSSDLAAFVPSAVLAGYPAPDNDNELAWLLGEQAGLPVEELPRSGATQFDVDTPTDLLTLAAHPDTRPHARACLDTMALDTTALDAALPLFLDRDAEVLVAGRVSSATWSFLERETACRTRVISEERGMRASRRQAQGLAQSVLGHLLDAIGLERFFDRLATLGQAVFLDNRVILAHRGLWPSAADRFYSDLRRPGQVTEPFLRELTEAALAAPIPVVMGGHSLVAGGMYALVEAAWARGHDVPRHIIPAGA